jgi:hypothetical protein
MGQSPRPVCDPKQQSKAAVSMYLPLYVEPRDVAEATTLMDTFGPKAGMEAAERAVQSRNVGNHLHYCRWRQIERLIIMLSARTTLGTIH